MAFDTRHARNGAHAHLHSGFRIREKAVSDCKGIKIVRIIGARQRYPKA